MTKLHPNFPLVRQTDVFERTDALIVSLHPKHLTIRLKGRRDEVEVDYGAVLDLGRKISFRRSMRKEA